ncbi:predicted protein [Nematostella vectensis]|uniref:Uncharacterized protein n=1 Tax=Nematostella vectensis TaxID=45351 RepID=A7RIP2_NEMVE|nr:predicted protein [Nematostella vectensis]|eukprot:XP_001640814.1 predicted protein [Nematostella vectensis]
MAIKFLEQPKRWPKGSRSYQRWPKRSWSNQKDGQKVSNNQRWPKSSWSNQKDGQKDLEATKDGQKGLGATKKMAKRISKLPKMAKKVLEQPKRWPKGSRSYQRWPKRSWSNQKDGQKDLEATKDGQKGLGATKKMAKRISKLPKMAKKVLEQPKRWPKRSRKKTKMAKLLTKLLQQPKTMANKFWSYQKDGQKGLGETRKMAKKEIGGQDIGKKVLQQLQTDSKNDQRHCRKSKKDKICLNDIQRKQIRKNRKCSKLAKKDRKPRIEVNNIGLDIVASYAERTYSYSTSIHGLEKKRNLYGRGESLV